jgi:hypothetical protein
MRDYGRVHATFWTSPTISPLTDTGRLLALYLMTCSHNTIAGVFRLPDGYIAEDMGWNSQRVGEGFGELSPNGFAQRCPVTKWVWIMKHLEWNRPENPNQWKAVTKIIASIPSTCTWLPDLNRSQRVVIPLNNSPVPVPVPVPVVGVQGEGKSKSTSRKPRSMPTTLPEGFAVSDRVLKWAVQQGLAGVIELHLEAFVSTCKAKGYTYVDWDEAFMSAVRKNWAKIEAPQSASADPRFAGAI